jgi:2-polyprenyl-3-methyl-5-hydroxy-6-metoxy-1,4-benzoquinol methylase
MKQPLLTPWLHQKRTGIVKNFISGNVLDLGCGPADLSEFKGVESYTGVELDNSRVLSLKKKYQNHLFYCMNLDRDEFPDRKHKFDTIVMIAVIEHLSSPNNILSQLPALLKKQGKLIITTPSPLGDRIHKIGANFGLVSKEAAEDHEHIYNEKELVDLLSKNGLKVHIYQKFILGLNQLVVCNLDSTGLNSNS